MDFFYYQSKNLQINLLLLLRDSGMGVNQSIERKIMTEKNYVSAVAF